MKKRILVLMHPQLIPPEKATQKEREEAEWKTEYDVVTTLRARGHEVLPFGDVNDLKSISETLHQFKPALAFNLLEEFDGVGTFDQNVVSYLELKRIQYTGNSPRGLMLGRDKALSKKILHYHRIPTPKFQVFPRHRRTKLRSNLPFPLIVKSIVEEASYGISQASVVTNESKLTERVEFIHESIGSDAIVEQFVEGRELYVAILGNRRLRVFPPWELLFEKPQGDLIEIATSQVKHNPKYREKHQITSDLAKDLTSDQIRNIQNICKRVYRALDQTGYSRIDIRLSKDGTPYILEANPNPDIAEYEDYSMSAYHGGIDYPELIQRIVNLGLRRAPQGRY